MVLETFQQGNATVEMSVYAVSEGDNIPENWVMTKKAFYVFKAIQKISLFTEIKQCKTYIIM